MTVRLSKLESSIIRYERKTSPVIDLSDAKFHNAMLRSLHREDGKNMRRIYALFENYYADLLQVKVELGVLTFLIKEKNGKFDKWTTKLEREGLSIFSTYYVQRFWELLHRVFQTQTLAQWFSHSIQVLKPLPLDKNWLKYAPQKFCKETQALQEIKSLYYRYAEDLNKKVQKVAKEQIDGLALLIAELGLYEQTVAHRGFPLNFIAHAFSKYHIRLPTSSGEHKTN